MKQQKAGREEGTQMDKYRKEKEMKRERKYQGKAEDEIRGKSQWFGGLCLY